MADYSGVDVWKVAAALRNPLGPAAALAPGEEAPAVSMSEVRERKENARQELLSRGLSDEAVEVIERDGPEANRVITDFLARGESRYGDSSESE